MCASVSGVVVSVVSVSLPVSFSMLVSILVVSVAVVSVSGV